MMGIPRLRPRDAVWSFKMPEIRFLIALTLAAIE